MDTAVVEYIKTKLGGVVGKSYASAQNRITIKSYTDVKTVSSMLGHFDAGFTLRTYTHVTRQMQESAAEKMGNFMAQVM